MHVRPSLFQSALLGSILALASLATGAQAGSYKDLHDFSGAPGDGSYPFNNVTFDTAGNLFGTTNLGGDSDNGTIFRIAPDGTESVLYSFAGGDDGSDPNAGVTIDLSTATLYGTASFGGDAGCRNGCGVLYELAADGTYTVLHTFNPAKDGRNPGGLLLRDKKGDLFGVTTGGGANNGGTVFEYSAKGKFSVLHAFGGADGFEPQGGVIADKAGNLYGVTYSGGADDYGTVFELTAKGVLTTLYSFTGGADGGNPTGGLDRDKAGDLYGATNLAGNGGAPYGTVFKLAPGGALTTLYTFADAADGGYPSGSVLFSHGMAYGTTSGGGADDLGAVYGIDTSDGVETVLHSFTGNEGATPQAGLTKKHGRLYGAAGGGGANNLGAVFSLKNK